LNHDSFIAFFTDIFLQAAIWRWGRLSLSQIRVPGLFPGEQCGPVRRADNLTTFMCTLTRNLGASNSWKP